MDRFSLHAGVRVEAGDRRRLEHLCRYACRPAIAESRLTLLPDGRVRYGLKRRWQDGTVAVVMDPQVLMERLCALVPRPRRHLVTYHGVFAPAAGIRDYVVPQRDGAAEAGCLHEAAGGDRRGDAGSEVDSAVRMLPPRRKRVVPHAPGKWRGGRPRYSWAELPRDGMARRGSPSTVV